MDTERQEKPQPRETAEPNELFVVYTDAQGLWANRVSKQLGRPRKLSFSIERTLLSLPPADPKAWPEVCFVSRMRLTEKEQANWPPAA